MKTLIKLRDNRYIASAGAGIKIWRVEDGVCVATIATPETTRNLCELQDGSLIGGTSKLTKWTLSDPKIGPEGGYQQSPLTFKGYTQPMNCVIQHSSGLIVSSSQISIRVWDPQSGGECLSSAHQDGCFYSLIELENQTVVTLCDLNLPPPRPLHRSKPGRHYAVQLYQLSRSGIVLQQSVPIVEDAARLIKLKDGSFAFGGGPFGDKVVFRTASCGASQDGFDVLRRWAHIRAEGVEEVLNATGDIPN